MNPWMKLVRASWALRHPHPLAHQNGSPDWLPSACERRRGAAGAFALRGTAARFTRSRGAMAAAKEQGNAAFKAGRFAEVAFRRSPRCQNHSVDA
jgi:hypothetical protein